MDINTDKTNVSLIKKKVRKHLIKLIKEYGEDDRVYVPTSISKKMELAELELDSLSTVEFIMDIEDAFDAEVGTIDGLDELITQPDATFKDLINLVTQYLYDYKGATCWEEL